MSFKKFDVQFSVLAKPNKGEHVCLIGDIPELGSWQFHSLKVMKPVRQRNEYEQSVWTQTLKIQFQANLIVSYRYVIATVIESEHEGEERDFMVRLWETHVQSRKLNIHDYVLKSDTNTDPDEFGVINGNYKVDKGWLTRQTEIQLRLFNNPISIWKNKYRDYDIFVKCLPINLQNKNDNSCEDEDSSLDVLYNAASFPITVSILNDALIEPSEQPEFGSLISKNEHITFRAQTFEPEFMGFKFDIYAKQMKHENNQIIDKLSINIGSAVLLPITITDTAGHKLIPITSNNNHPIGKINVEYLIIKPMKDEVTWDFSVSYAKHWRYTRAPLNVGHRGLGATYAKDVPSKIKTFFGKIVNKVNKQFYTQSQVLSNLPEIESTTNINLVEGTSRYDREQLFSKPENFNSKLTTAKENTLASLAEAGSHGADFVEFDVQLSRDNIPIIYHDFKVCLDLKKKNAPSRNISTVPLDVFEIPISDLTVEQLHMLKLYHTSGKNRNKSSEVNSDEINEIMNQPFPTLQSCFELLDDLIGFNIEIKYCMKVKSGVFGVFEENMKDYMERNEYVDIILSETMKYAKNRRIIFSCFDPDVCCMLRLKQNKYPVLFLSQGETEKYPAYHDPRCWSTHNSILFSRAESLLGINAHAEDLMKRPELINDAKLNGLVVFCWGDDNNDSKNIDFLKMKGVDGVIFDRINELNKRSENKFKMEHNEKMKLLKDMFQQQNIDTLPIKGGQSIF